MLRTRALCIWLGFGFAHGGHWLFLAAKARVQRPRTHLGAAAQPRVAQVVPAHGQELAAADQLPVAAQRMWTSALQLRGEPDRPSRENPCCLAC